MTELHIYYIVLVSFLALGAITFIVLLFIAAPYGRYATKGWGPLINNKLGWIIQEAPASLLMFFYFFFDSRPANLTAVVLLLIWQSHYFYRAFIYPFTLRGNNQVPLSTVLLAVLFNIVNTYVQGRWLFNLSPEIMYTLHWLTDPRFIIGTLIFITGFIINKHSDYILRTLRAPGESGYKVPRGGLFEYISCPNYFGEMITWTGWAIATWSLGGIFFLVWTIANLGPRARAHHTWYKKTFSDYPKKRKILIPFIY
jgi:3-oxo-5-alpha-steroid 4-dehydrogenase 1